MRCPYCQSTSTTERPTQTALGYRRFRCRECQRGFNERTGTPFNRLQYPTDVICLVGLWRFRYKLSLRDLAEMFLQRGLIFTHEAVRDWEAKLAPLLSGVLRRRRHGAVGASWYVDETYIRVQGRWCYLYRAIDRDGHLIDARLSDTRDLAAAEAFFGPTKGTVRCDPVTVVGSKNQTGLVLCREHGIVWGRMVAISQIALANTYDGPFVAVVIEIKELHRHPARGCLPHNA
jgi:putative transposase